MSTILKFRGARALSEFRVAKLLSSLRSVHRGLRGIAAEFWHFVEAEAPLSAQEESVLARLLEYGTPLDGERGGGAVLVVVPRIGTISPWSSKATEIAKVCGLTKIRRI